MMAPIDSAFAVPTDPTPRRYVPSLCTCGMPPGGEPLLAVLDCALEQHAVFVDMTQEQVDRVALQLRQGRMRDGFVWHRYERRRGKVRG